MNYNAYIGCVVKIETSNGYYYVGKVLDADDDFIQIRDKHDNLTNLAINTIVLIREVKNGNP